MTKQSYYNKILMHEIVLPSILLGSETFETTELDFLRDFTTLHSLITLEVSTCLFLSVQLRKRWHEFTSPFRVV